MKLTARQVFSLKPKDKTYLIADGHGLSIQVNSNGNKYWRFRNVHEITPTTSRKNLTGLLRILERHGRPCMLNINPD